MYNIIPYPQKPSWNKDKLVGLKRPLNLRRLTKATLIYKKTKKQRPVQILLGHTKLKSSLRYLGIEVDNALEFSETVDI